MLSLYDKGENDELCKLYNEKFFKMFCDLPRAASVIVYIYYYIYSSKKVNYFGEKNFILFKLFVSFKF